VQAIIIGVWTSRTQVSWYQVNSYPS